MIELSAYLAHGMFKVGEVNQHLTAVITLKPLVA